MPTLNKKLGLNKLHQDLTLDQVKGIFIFIQFYILLINLHITIISILHLSLEKHPEKLIIFENYPFIS